ncbi:hypothetical protein V2J09_016606 [Rumex salicifolius]
MEIVCKYFSQSTAVLAARTQFRFGTTVFIAGQSTAPVHPALLALATIDSRYHRWVKHEVRKIVKRLNLKEGNQKLEKSKRIAPIWRVVVAGNLGDCSDEFPEIMFPWNIAKSAEAIFSRFALRRICKFLLKKKLGQFILGEIDLEQLDVQLTAGIIHLYDLALNVDYINHELGCKTPIRVQAGSIHSLLLQLPWSGEGCHVEIDEIELQLMLANCDDHGLSESSSPYDSSQDDSSVTNLEKHIHHAVNESTISASGSVHEGVKAVANMIKSLLTSFHVKIRKVIVALDPCTENCEIDIKLQKTLVMRITEIECGTHISTEEFQHASRLTNFLKFKGATLELLQVDDAKNHEPVPSVPGWGSSPLATTNILTGKECGFSGTLSVSLPWNNGSLDIRKVDADVQIDPIKLKLEPRILKWFFILWETLNSYENGKNGIDVNLNSSCLSSVLDHTLRPAAKSKQSCGSSSVDLCFSLREEKLPDILLPESNLIFDWVPYSIGKNQKDGIQEVDLCASVDQFFECFDGMRSSQSLLGGSGMWNWTCSVFSAITAASSLASGSPHFPVERQHIETNLKINLSEVSVEFFFFDEDRMDMQESAYHSDVETDLHYVGSRWVDVDIMMQVCPKEWKLEATVKNIDLNDYFADYCEAVVPGLGNQEKIAAGKTLLIQSLQNEVQNALPCSTVSVENSDAGVVNASATYNPLLSVGGCASSKGFKSKSNKVVKASLLKTNGTCSFQIIRTSTFSNGSFTGPTSFSFELPPFVFWVNFDLLSMFMNLLERIQGSCEVESSLRNLTSDVLEEQQQYISDVDAHGRHYSGQKTTTVERSLQGNIFVPNGRVILCFPFKNEKGFSSYFSWNQFIALDFLSLPKTEQRSPSEEVGCMNKCALPSSCSLHLKIADIDMYLITMASNGGHNSYNSEELKFSSNRVVSLRNRASCPSIVSVLWPKNAVTGPWISKSAKLLATSGEFETKHKPVRKGYEFASVATRKDVENLNSQARKKMVSSSEILLHVDLSSVMITLIGTHYALINSLVNQLITGLSSPTSGSISRHKETSGSQESILIECEALEVLVNFDPVNCSKSSLQRELPGSWTTMKLDVNDFQLLYVSNTGGVKDANFFWLGHAEGKLCGSVGDVPGREFVLIECNNNAMGRGDGDGLNVLSSRTAGSDIVHFYNSENMHSFITVTMKCGTIFAPGGRLDWLDCLCSFFRLPSREADNSLREAKVQDDVIAGCSFILNLVDVGFSYEPHNTWSVSSPSCVNSKCGHSIDVENKLEQPIIACMLAAASLKVSNTTIPGTCESEYHIQIQDLGLLLRAIPAAASSSSDFSFGYIHKTGYTKVASETLLEAVLRMNWEKDLIWELNCFESHIVLSTCHDTTMGLMHLASQIQQLVAPDVEESLVHFQNRWQAVQRLQGENTFEKEIVVDTSLPSEIKPVDSKTESEDGTAGLLNMIYEDAFHFHANSLQQLDLEGTKYNVVDRMQQGECSNDKCSDNVSKVAGGSFMVPGSQSHRNSVLDNAELIEGYCLSNFCPLSDDIIKSKLLNVVNQDVRRVNCGWYGNTSLQILDNHISDDTDQTSSTEVVDEELLYAKQSGNDICRSFKGRVHLNNVNVKWQMLSGSAWHDLGQTSGGDRHVCLELELLNMMIQYDIFPEEDVSVSKLCLSIEDFCLYDKSIRAPWKLVLGYYASKGHPRESSSKALKINLEAVRPDPTTPLEEYRLHVAVLPILLHLHQSQLDFLIEFFGGKSFSADSVSQNTVPVKSNDPEGCTINYEALLPFFQKFDIQPIVLRVDYRPSRVDLAALSGGKYVELVNVVPWKGVELHLKHVHAVGVYGWKNLCEIMTEEWLEDISQNQIHKLLNGFPPIRSLVAVGSGAAKFVSLPISSYRKDQKLLKGLQRGTIAFLRSISVEAVRLGVHVAAGAHDILLHTESVLACMQPSVQWPSESELKTNVRSDQPRNAQQGLQQAYDSLSDGLGRATSAIIHTPIKSYQRGSGAGSAFVSAVMGAPAAAVAPASAAAQALHCALLGFRNSLDPEHKNESINKYSDRRSSSEQS